MTSQELKQYINDKLGNSVRCLLPSYWWKRLFHSVADRIDEVEEKIGSTKVDINVDSSLSLTSSNPVANSTITSELAKKQNTLVNGSNIKTINGDNILGSGDLQFDEAFCVVLDSDEISSQFILVTLSDLIGRSTTNLRGVVPFFSTDPDGNIIGYEYCEVDVTNYHYDATTNTVYGFYEFCHDGVRYRRTYNFNTYAFVGEEVISSGSVDTTTGTTTVPIVNSEEELKANYSSTEIAAAKIIEAISIRDWVRGTTIVKQLLFTPTVEAVETSTAKRGFSIATTDLSCGVSVVVTKDGAIHAYTVIDNVESDELTLYENGALVEDVANQLNKVLAENECYYYYITSTNETTYALLDSFVKAGVDKGLANYTNGSIEYFVTTEKLKQDILAIEEVIAASLNDLNERLDSYNGGEVDTEMSDDSENVVQNRVIKEYVDSAIQSNIFIALNTEV